MNKILYTFPLRYLSCATITWKHFSAKESLSVTYVLKGKALDVTKKSSSESGTPFFHLKKKAKVIESK